MEDQVIQRLAADAHHSHSFSIAEYEHPTKGLSPMLFCTQCGVYATSRAVGIKDKCTPPAEKTGRGRAKQQHRCQHHLEDIAECNERVADNEGLSAGALAKQRRTPKGATGANLHKIRQGFHPQFSQSRLSNIRPLRHNTGKCLGPNTANRSNAQAASSQGGIHEEEALDVKGTQFQQEAVSDSDLLCELEELEQQALRAAGMEVTPEEEDMYCSVGW